MGERALMIKAKGGLGNRMLSAITGLVYAELSGRRSVIDWRDGLYAPAGVNAYPLLFEPPNDAAPDAVERCADVTPDIWSGALHRHPVEMIVANDPNRHSDPLIYRKYCVDIKRLDHPAELAVFWSYLPKLRRLRRLRRADAALARLSDEQVFIKFLKSHFTPNERVRTEVTKKIDRLARPIIGVHVRYTDRKTPLGPIRRALHALRRRKPWAPIFLATDSAHVERLFAEEFDDLYVTEKYLPENAEQLHLSSAPVDLTFEAENALIDMYALAQCDYLVYSKNSTFSICSALYGEIPQSRQVDIDRYNMKIVAKRLVQEYT